MKPEETLRTQLRDSTLPEEDAAAFYSVLLLAESSDLRTLTDLFSEDASWIEWLFENYKEKVEALKTADGEKMKEILGKEKELLKNT